MWGFELDPGAASLHYEKMTTVGRAASCALCCFAIGCAASPPSSGQTGSPNKEDPPSYETPHPPPPGEGGGVIGGDSGSPPGGGILPRGKPEPRGMEIDDLLLVAGSGLGLFRLSDEGTEFAGQWEPESEVTQLAASALDRVSLVVTTDVKLREPSIPEEPVPQRRARLVELDASDPAAPAVLREFALSPNVVRVVATASGHTLIGGDLAEQEPRCGGGLLGEQSRPVRETWLTKLEPAGSGFSVASERRFGSGYFELGTDREHAVFVPALHEATDDPVLEVVEMESLDTVATLTVPRAELDPNSSFLGADVRGGLALVTGWERLFLYDLSSGALVQTIGTAGPITGVSFVADDYAVADGAPGVFVLDRTSVPAAVGFLPTSGRSADLPTGVLRAFGDGFVELTATNADSSRLVAIRYTLLDGQLDATAEAHTEVPHYVSAYAPGQDNFQWVVDTESATLAVDFEVFDEARGDDDYFLGAVQGTEGGSLVASEPLMIEGRYGDPVFFDDRVGYASPEFFESFGVESQSEALRLIPQGATRLGLLGVRFEVEHAGRVFAMHRNSYGRTDVSHRSPDSSDPTFIDLPHRTEALLPIDETHLAAVGYALSSDCAEGPQPECGIGGTGLVQPNGLSVLSVDGDNVAVVTSMALEPEGSSPPDGAHRTVYWNGVLTLADDQWLLVASVLDSCDSVESCEALGVEAVIEEGTPAGPPGCAGEDCPEEPPLPDPTEYVSGRRDSNWLVPVDLRDPGRPLLGKPTEGGLHNYVGEETLSLLHVGDNGGTAETWGYASQERLYTPEGNSELNEYGHEITRNWLQLFTLEDRKPRFGDPINVPGQVVLLGRGGWAHAADATHSAFSLAAAYDANGTAYATLTRLALESDRATVTEVLSLEARAYDAVGQGSRVVLVERPLDVCDPDASYALTVVDVAGEQFVISRPLALAPGTWGFDRYSLPSSEPGLVYVTGGPASPGRAVVDITTDPPEVVRYETFEY